MPGLVDLITAASNNRPGVKGVVTSRAPMLRAPGAPSMDAKSIERRANPQSLSEGVAAPDVEHKGILAGLFGADSGAARWADENRNLLLSIGSSLLSPGMDFSGMPAAAKADQQRGEERRQRNSTMELFSREAPDLASAVQAGLPINDAFAEYLQRQRPGYGQENMTANQRDFQFARTNPGFVDFLRSDAGGGGSMSLQPQYATDPATGQLVLGQLSDSGTFNRTDMGGLVPLGPYDLSAQRAAGSSFGKQTGAAQFDMPAAKLTMDQTISALDEIRSNPQGAAEQFGNLMGIPQQITPAWPGSPKADFRNSVTRGTNLAFLQARELLRGGGQITDFESKKAETAITDMQIAMESGSRPAFDKALSDFEQAVKDGYAKLSTQAGAMPGYGNAGQARPQAGAPPVGTVEGGYRYIGGDPSQPTSWEQVQ